MKGIQEYDTQKPPLMFLRASVSPEVATDEASMVSLACKLNSDFGHEGRIDACILDDKETAQKFFLPNEHSPRYIIDLSHLRGHYVLERTKGEQSIEFLIPEVQDELPRLRRVKVEIPLSK